MLRSYDKETKKMVVLDVKNLTKIYSSKKNSFTAVDNISFSLGKGEIVGFLGPAFCVNHT
jgi:ABC-type multidrug transport system ATPase subunit